MKLVEGPLAIRHYFLKAGLPLTAFDGARITIEFPDKHSVGHAIALLQNDPMWRDQLGALIYPVDHVTRFRIVGFNLQLEQRCLNRR